MGLYSIAYVSKAVRSLYEDELVDLLTKARERNMRENITGLLLYSNMRFVQYIEGPELGVKKLFAEILVDSRHVDVSLLLDEAIAERDFGSWTMGYLPLSSKAVDDFIISWPHRQQHNWIISGARGKQLLQILWSHINVQ